MSERDELARAIFVYDNGRLDQAAAEVEWEEVRGPNEPRYAYLIADGLIAAGYRKQES